MAAQSRRWRGVITIEPEWSEHDRRPVITISGPQQGPIVLRALGGPGGIVAMEIGRPDRRAVAAALREAARLLVGDEERA